MGCWRRDKEEDVVAVGARARVPGVWVTGLRFGSRKAATWVAGGGKAGKRMLWPLGSGVAVGAWCTQFLSTLHATGVRYTQFCSHATRNWGTVHAVLPPRCTQVGDGARSFAATLHAKWYGTRSFAATLHAKWYGTRNSAPRYTQLGHGTRSFLCLENCVKQQTRR